MKTLPQIKTITLNDFEVCNKELFEDIGERQKLDEFINMEAGQIFDNENAYEITKIEIFPSLIISGTKEIPIAAIHYTIKF